MDEHYNASNACVRLHWDLSDFTLSLQDADYIHQLASDAYTAQHSSLKLKPITMCFALIGLYLAVERGYTGKQVQQTHMALGLHALEWPRFYVPGKWGNLTVLDVLQSPTEQHVSMIKKWAKTVWDIWEPEHQNVRLLVKQLLNK